MKTCQRSSRPLCSLANAFALGAFLVSAVFIQASPIMQSWAFQDSGTTVSLGVADSPRHMDVWLNGFAVVRGTDNVTRIREAGSSIWTALSIAAPAYDRRDSLAIASDHWFYVGCYGSGDSGTRRWVVYSLTGDPPAWRTYEYRPNNNINTRIQAAWAHREEGKLTGIASLMQVGLFRAASGSTQWSQVYADTGTVTAFSVGSSAQNIIGTSGQNYVLRSTDDGYNFTLIAEGADEIPFAAKGLTAVGDNLHWICGDGGQIAFWDASAGSPAYISQNSGTEKNLYSMWAVSETSVWAVGQDATVLYYDGSEWMSVDLGLPGLGDGDHFYDVAADAYGNVTISGNKGTIIAGMIPEPGVAGLLLAAASGFFLCRRKKQGWMVATGPSS